MPSRPVFLKPNVTRIAARAYGFDFQYESKPNWATYANLLEFAETVRRDVRDLKPRDMIDVGIGDNDAADRAMPHAEARMQSAGGDNLLAQIGRGVDEHKSLAVKR